VASHEFINQCAKEILLIDRQGNSLTELAVSELINSGEVKRHIRRTFKIYNERRTVMAETLTEKLPQIAFSLPQGGLAFWLRMPEFNIKAFVEKANHNKVSVLPGSLFTYRNDEVQALRMGFASLSNEEIIEGIDRLHGAFLTMQ